MTVEELSRLRVGVQQTNLYVRKKNRERDGAFLCCQQSEGEGWFINKSWYIVTNRFVVANSCLTCAQEGMIYYVYQNQIIMIICKVIAKSS